MTVLEAERTLLLRQDLVFVDVETTGFDPVKDRVVEIGIIKISGGKITETFSSLINPELDQIPSSVQRITGIKPKQLVKAPIFSEVKEKVFALLQNAIFVAHNVDFDYNFMDNTLSRHSLYISLPRLCTVKLSRELYPDYMSHNLDSISNRFNIMIDSRHRALDDAVATYEFFKLSHTRLGTRAVQQAMIKLMKEAKPKRVGKVAVKQMSLM